MQDQANSESRPPERYSQKSNPEFEAFMARRTAAKEGAFFLQQLRSGMRVLDVGCGPGSITLGIAEVAAPGEVVGVDFQQSQVERGRELSTERGVTNAKFEVADVYRLPFADGSFDAVFAHAVLMHLREPVRALQEIRRVLRRDGFVGVRDCDWGGRIFAPITPLLERWFSLTVRVRQRNGGNPLMGRNHRRLLLDAGFERADASASVWCSGSSEDIKQCAVFLKAQLQGFASAALEEGWMDRSTIEAVAAEIQAWSERPDAFYMDTYCEALGWQR